MSAVDGARRLYNFPLGVLGISLATVAFPLFSRHAANKDYGALGQSVGGAFRLALFEAIPSGVALMVLSELIVKVAFERGNFTAADTERTAHVLRCYSLGLWAYCTHHIVLRAFYSLQDTITPLRVMGKTLLLALVLDMSLLWLPAVREGAFGLSTSIMASLNVAILGWMLSRRVGSIEGRRILATAGQTAGASAAMGAAAWAACRYLPIHNKYLLFMACVGVGAGVFFGACRLLGIAEARELLSLARSRRGRKS